MAKEWYLIKSPYFQFSGFEGEPYDGISDAFQEIASTDIAENVEVYNFDLSERKAVRAILQGNTADTKLKTRGRTMLVPIGTCTAGMYVKYKGKYWIIVGMVDDNRLYEKAILSLCNYLISWINSAGKLVQRWVSITSASQYNNGETGQQYYFVRSDQLMVVMPDDDDSLMLNTGHRFIIDKKCSVYEKMVDPDTSVDTSFDVQTYQLTRIDTVLFDYQGSGHSEFMAYQDEQRDRDGYYVIDGNGCWLCDQPTENTFAQVKKASEIQYSSDTIYLGISSAKFTAKFYDETGNEIEASPTWDISCDFADKLIVEYDGASIIISAKDKTLIHKQFELKMSADGYSELSVTVTILPLI